MRFGLIFPTYPCTTRHLCRLTFWRVRPTPGRRRVFDMHALHCFFFFFFFFSCVLTDLLPFRPAVIGAGCARTLTTNQKNFALRILSAGWGDNLFPDSLLHLRNSLTRGLWQPSRPERSSFRLSTKAALSSADVPPPSSSTASPIFLVPRFLKQFSPPRTEIRTYGRPLPLRSVRSILTVLLISVTRRTMYRRPRGVDPPFREFVLLMFVAESRAAY